MSMQATLRRDHVKSLVGTHIYAVKKDGSIVTGKLMQVKGNRLYIAPKGKKQVKTSAIAPLVLFDLLAIGTAPSAFGGFGYPGFYGGFGYPGFFW